MIDLHRAGEEEQHWIRSRPLEILRGTSGPASRGPYRVRAGEHHGLRVALFNLRYSNGYSGSDPRPTYAAAVAQLPWRVEARFTLDRRGLLRDAPGHPSLPQIRAGTPRLQHAFHIRSLTDTATESTLTPDLCEWILHQPALLHFELAHDTVLIYRALLGGLGRIGLTRRAIDFSRQAIPHR